MRSNTWICDHWSGRQHIRKPEHVGLELRKIYPGRWIAFRLYKNRNGSPVDLMIPILPALEAVLAQLPCGALTCLETAHGKPHTVKGFSSRCVDCCV